MASQRAKTQKAPVKINLDDGSVFKCPCGSTEFRHVEEPLHWFCRCGQVYTAKDLTEGMSG